MKSKVAERNTVIGLFVLVLITFSLAQRDSKRLERLYTTWQAKKTSPVAVKTITAHKAVLK